MNPTYECYMSAFTRARELARQGVESPDPDVDADAFHVICDALDAYETQMKKLGLEPWYSYSGEPDPGPLNRFHVTISITENSTLVKIGEIEVEAVDFYNAGEKALNNMGDVRLEGLPLSKVHLKTELLGPQQEQA